MSNTQNNKKKPSLESDICKGLETKDELPDKIVEEFIKLLSSFEKTKHYLNILDRTKFSVLITDANFIESSDITKYTFQVDKVITPSDKQVYFKLSIKPMIKTRLNISKDK